MFTAYEATTNWQKDRAYRCNIRVICMLFFVGDSIQNGLMNHFTLYDIEKESAEGSFFIAMHINTWSRETFLIVRMIKK